MAIKTFNHLGMMRPPDIRKREFDVLKKLDHENIVKIFDTEVEVSTYRIVAVCLECLPCPFVPLRGCKLSRIALISWCMNNFFLTKVRDYDCSTVVFCSFRSRCSVDQLYVPGVNGWSKFPLGYCALVLFIF